MTVPSAIHRQIKLACDHQGPGSLPWGFKPQYVVLWFTTQDGCPNSSHPISNPAGRQWKENKIIQALYSLPGSSAFTWWVLPAGFPWVSWTRPINYNTKKPGLVGSAWVSVSRDDSRGFCCSAANKPFVHQLEITWKQRCLYRIYIFKSF